MKKILSKNLILAFILGLLFLLFVYLVFGPISLPEKTPTVITPFLSTFFGASFAFYLNSRKELRKEDEIRVSALRVAMFTIAQQQNVLAQVWKRSSRWKDRPDKLFNMQPLSLPDSEHLRQNLSALSFMIPIEPTLLLELTVEDDRFAQTITAIERHADFHVSQVQPALAKSSLYRKISSVSEIKEAIGTLIFGTAKANAENVFEHLAPTRNSLSDMMPKLYVFAKGLYPDEDFLRTDFILDEDVVSKVSNYAVPLSGIIISTQLQASLKDWHKR
jgi:hypothetical protein